MALQLITPPTREPLSLAETKAHLRIDGTDEDNLIRALIPSARRYCEGFLNRALLTQTWDLWLDAFPGKDHIDIPLPPLQSVTHIKYYDTDGTEATMDSADYIVDAVSEPGRIVLAYGESWPSTILRPAKGVVMRFVAGYAAYSGTVSTSGTAVTKTAGSDFNAAWIPDKNITINGVVYSIAAVGSTTGLTLNATAGTQTGVAYQTNNVSENIIQAMKLLIGHWHENREGVLTGAISKEIEFAVKALLWLDRVCVL